MTNIQHAHLYGMREAATLGALAPMTVSLINRNRGGTGVSGTIT